MQELMMAILVWLGGDAELPLVQTVPRVEFVASGGLRELRLSRLEAAGLQVRGDSVDAPDVLAFYDGRQQMLFLPIGWSAASPADVSLLVHELAHHVQHASDLQYPCAAAREEVAYRAQSRWMEFYGSSLADAFEIDPMTLLLRTRCLQ